MIQEKTFVPYLHLRSGIHVILNSGQRLLTDRTEALFPAFSQNPDHSADSVYIARFQMHQLRHTAATRWRRMYGLEATSTVLGHKSMAVTELYAEKNEALAVKIATETG